MSFELHVAVRRQGRGHLEIAFDRSPITLGALPHNDVVLSDPYVSGEHATVMVSRGELLFRDTSRNGSFVDGERVHEVHLGHRGRVEVPPFEIELTFRSVADPRQTRHRGGAAGSEVEPVAEAAPEAAPAAATDEDEEAPRDTAVPVTVEPARDAGREASAVSDPEDSTVLTGDVPAVPPRVRLHVVHGGEIEDGEVVDLPALPAVRLGRSQGADVTLPVMTVSRLHAVVRWGDDGGIVVADLGSSNGTFVNGKRLDREPQPLADGDQLRFGELILDVELVPWQEAARPARAEPAAEPAGPAGG